MSMFCDGLRSRIAVCDFFEVADCIDREVTTLVSENLFSDFYLDELVFGRADAQLLGVLERHAPVGRREGRVKAVGVAFYYAVVAVRSLLLQIFAEYRVCVCRL